MANGNCSKGRMMFLKAIIDPLSFRITRIDFEILELHKIKSLEFRSCVFEVKILRAAHVLNIRAIYRSMYFEV